MFEDQYFFDDDSDGPSSSVDFLEQGLSHEILDDELYLPSHPSRDWIRCFVSSTGPGTFRMYLEGKKRTRFLLSAKQFSVGDAFLISTNEDFPMLERLPKRGFVAWLEKQRDGSYLLGLNHCHLCDHRLGRFTCGRSEIEREVVARISHTFRSFRPLNLQFRCVSVLVPSISRAGKRKIWCPRSFRDGLAAGLVGADVDLSAALALDSRKESSLALRNRAPEWSEELQSLVVKFHGNRILTASSRNFLLCASRCGAGEAQNALSVYSDSEEDEHKLRDRERASSVGSASSTATTSTASSSSSFNNNNNNNNNTSNNSSGMRVFPTIDAVQAARTRRLKALDVAQRNRSRSRSRSRSGSLSLTPKQLLKKSMAAPLPTPALLPSGPPLPVTSSGGKGSHSATSPGLSLQHRKQLPNTNNPYSAAVVAPPGESELLW
jgi:hypothetical protein